MNRLFIQVILSIVSLTIFQIHVHAENLTADKDINGSYDRNIEQRIRDSYLSQDFPTTVKLLEMQTARMRESLSKKEKVNALKVFQNQRFLAYLYACKLNNTDRALVECQKLIDLRASLPEINELPAIEYLDMGEIYEMRKDFYKALEYYQKCLDAFQSLQEKEHDDFSIMLDGELIKIVKYRIDGINLRADKEHKLLLEKIKPVTSPGYLVVFQMLSHILAPTAEYDMNIAMKSDLPIYIKQSSSCLASEHLNFMLVLSASGSNIDETSEKAMNAYLSKYPDSYYALILGSAFHKYYKKNEMVEKEKALFKELQNIAKKRKIELMLTPNPDKRFVSPEKTWETYKKSLLEGNIETLTSCYVPGQNAKMRQMYNAMGKEMMKVAGTELGTIEKVTVSEQTAKYLIKRTESGKIFAYDVIFHNIDGEWKMMPF